MLKQTIKRTLFRLARSRFAYLFMGWSFRYMSWAIPVERLYETDSLIAFHHPVPTHPVHVLIVPKRTYATLLELSPADSAFQRDLFETVQKLVRDLHLAQGSYSLVCNGGGFQDVPHLHFHLIGSTAR